MKEHNPKWMANLPNRTYGQMTRPVVTDRHTYVVYAPMWWNRNELHFVSVGFQIIWLDTCLVNVDRGNMYLRFSVKQQCFKGSSSRYPCIKNAKYQEEQNDTLWICDTGYSMIYLSLEKEKNYFKV